MLIRQNERDPVRHSGCSGIRDTGTPSHSHGTSSRATEVTVWRALESVTASNPTKTLGLPGVYETKPRFPSFHKNFESRAE